MPIIVSPSSGSAAVGRQIFLELVNRTRRECGVSSQDLTSFSTLSTEDQRVKNWVAQAWIDLQMHKPDWQWMRKQTSFPTVANQQQYTDVQANAPDLADWKEDTYRSYVTALGQPSEQILPFMHYERFRNLYLFGNGAVQTGRPVCFTVAPGAKSVILGPTPDAGGYTIEANYYRAPTELILPSDSPADPGNDLPSRWHMLLVFLAMEMYASYEAAPEVMARAVANKKRLLQRLEFDQLPTLHMGPPLA